VKNTFETGLIFDQQTVESPMPKSFDFAIQHRFGLLSDGADDLFGIYSKANIRLGLDFGITNRIMIGIGATKDNKQKDASLKVALLKQTRSGRIPLSVSYYGNMVIDGSEKSEFGVEEEYKFIHRISYFHQLIISRKFSDRISLQVSPSMSYFNAIKPGYKNIYYSISAAGRVKITDVIGINLGYDHPLTSGSNKPSLSAGFEIGTSTHAFQLFITNYPELINQYNFAYSSYSIEKSEFLVGLNITVRF
jgi:hypothetical protein